MTLSREKDYHIVMEEGYLCADLNASGSVRHGERDISRVTRTGGCLMVVLGARV